MKKYDQWNIIKKKTDRLTKTIYINEREIRYIHLGINIGNEQDGKGPSFQRPVLVLKRIGNVYRVAPMTTGGKDSRYYYSLPPSYFGTASRIILSQVRIIDKKRFTDKIKTIDLSEYQAIQKKLRALLL